MEVTATFENLETVDPSAVFGADDATIPSEQGIEVQHLAGTGEQGIEVGGEEGIHLPLGDQEIEVSGDQDHEVHHLAGTGMTGDQGIEVQHICGGNKGIEVCHLPGGEQRVKVQSLPGGDQGIEVQHLPGGNQSQRIEVQHLPGGVKFVVVDVSVDGESSQLSIEQHQCCLCNEMFISEVLLAEHLQNHGNVSNNVESEMSEVIILDSDSEDVTVTDVTEEQPLLVCSVCSKMFEQKDLLDEHVKSHKIDLSLTGNVLDSHDYLGTRSDCPVCQQSFPCKRTHEEHLENHRKGDQCDVCGQFYVSQAGFAKHLNSHSTPESPGQFEKRHECIQCGKKFRTLENLHTHIRIHTGEKPYECVECNKRFTQKANLQHHMRIHTGERPFKCSLCSKAFTQVANLNAHFRIHTGEKPYACPDCDDTFRQLSSLNAHKKACQKKKQQQQDKVGGKYPYSTILAPPFIREVKYTRRKGTVKKEGEVKKPAKQEVQQDELPSSHDQNQDDGADNTVTVFNQTFAKGTCILLKRVEVNEEK